MTTARARIAYFNGRFVPEPEVLVPFRDRGFKYGDAVFDTTRTFGHRVFKMREHIDRLYRSLRLCRAIPEAAQVDRAGGPFLRELYRRRAKWVLITRARYQLVRESTDAN